MTVRELVDRLSPSAQMVSRDDEREIQAQAGALDAELARLAEVERERDDYIERLRTRVYTTETALQQKHQAFEAEREKVRRLVECLHTIHVWNEDEVGDPINREVDDLLTTVSDLILDEPNAETAAAIEAVDRGEVTRVGSVDQLMESLNSDGPNQTIGEALEIAHNRTDDEVKS